MSGHTADSCRHLGGAWRFVAGVLHVVLVLLLVAEAGALNVAPQEESGRRTHEGFQQDHFESAEASPIGSAVRLIEIRLTLDRASDRKSGSAFDVSSSASSGASSNVVRHGNASETGAVAAAFHGPLYHLHRSLLI